MQILNRQKAQDLKGVKMGRFNRTASIIYALNRLEVDQGLRISAGEWPIKTPPNTYIHQAFRLSRSDKKFKVKTLADGSGWVALRIR